MSTHFGDKTAGAGGDGHKVIASGGFGFSY